MRGINRFKSILLACDFLKELPKVQSSGIVVPDLPYLKESTNTETSLGNPALATEIEASAGTKRKELEKVMEWSLGGNDMIEQVVHNLLSFPRSRESLQKLQGQAVCWSFRRRPRSPKTGVG